MVRRAPAFGGKARGLLFLQKRGEGFDFKLEPAGAFFGGFDTLCEFSLADREDVAAELEVLLLAVECLAARLILGPRPATGLVEALQPESLGGVEHGFRKAVQGGGSGIEASGEAAPPGVEQRVDRIRAAAAYFPANLFDRRTLAFAEESVGGAVHVGGGDAATGRWCARGWVGGSRNRHVTNNTDNVWRMKWKA